MASQIFNARARNISLWRSHHACDELCLDLGFGMGAIAVSVVSATTKIQDRCYGCIILVEDAM